MPGDLALLLGAAPGRARTPETLYLEDRCFPEAIETEDGVATTQISELGRAQRGARPVAAVSDRAAATTVEPVPRIALTQQEACASLGCSEELFARSPVPPGCAPGP
ncbi:MAG: hypothetical protein ACLP22_18395 [Solirubrobacteraceae bacterium]|jgi:hypothetical protein